jgi:hypothetical protein
LAGLAGTLTRLEVPGLHAGEEFQRALAHLVLPWRWTQGMADAFASLTGLTHLEHSSVQGPGDDSDSSSTEALSHMTSLVVLKSRSCSWPDFACLPLAQLQVLQHIEVPWDSLYGSKEQSEMLPEFGMPLPGGAALMHQPLVQPSEPAVSCGLLGMARLRAITQLSFPPSYSVTRNEALALGRAILSLPCLQVLKVSGVVEGNEFDELAQARARAPALRDLSCCLTELWATGAGNASLFGGAEDAEPGGLQGVTAWK